MQRQNKTSWEGVHGWYSNLVGKQGHFYHQQVIIPNILALLDVSKEKSSILLDLACGQGVLARNLPETIEYWGVDLSPSLIREAKKLTSKKDCHFYVGDVTKSLNLPLTKANIVTLILAIQDLSEPEKAIVQAGHYLESGGQFLIVMNHPCFRIPRQSEWGVDEAKKLQYRRMNGYLHSNTIPIQTSPGKGEKSPTVLYSHHPLKDYSKWLKHHGFVIELLDEWTSEKKSEGPKKRMEDRARTEFPLFLCILARKL
jgi:ubiquinone/menaquinone biosynthesis C-methylase UbiE